jgi:hypothetical protein
MGLLNADERRELIRLLLELPSIEDPDTRSALLANLPHNLLMRLKHGGRPRNQLTDAVAILDGPVDRDTARRADGTWPIVILLQNALPEAEGYPAEEPLRRLLQSALWRAATRATRQPGAAISSPEGEGALEQLVNNRAFFSDVVPWIRRVAQNVGAVCRVESPDTFGSGFLIRPDLVLTNYHVLQAVIGGETPLSQVGLRFDYFADTPGAGLLTRLATDGLIASSPPDELDFALVRLEAPLGVSPALGQEGVQGRCWLMPAAHTSDLGPGSPLFILQHPQGSWLKIATGTVVAEQGPPGRIFYRTNTEPGSSGSPCFNDRWELVAIHHFGRPSSNQGVPIMAILAHPAVQAALA